MADDKYSLDEEVLAGGWQTDVRRSGDLVLRSAGPQSPTVIRLLDHLEAVGFDAAPKPVDGGIAADGREQLTFVEGESPQPNAWSYEAAFTVGAMLRELHDATATFELGPDAVWRPWFARLLPGTHPVIGHGDLGPWNILAIDGAPTAFIDWDNAGPVDGHWELAQLAWLNAQLHDDDVADLNALPSIAERANQLRLILDGYQLEASERPPIVDMMIEFAIRSARDEAVGANVGPETVSPDDAGFPLLWAVTWRTRAAAWMLDHRSDLIAALNR